MTRNILYVDDDPDHLELVRNLLERDSGVVVDVCCTSKGAEEFLNRRCYDVVILDVNLPGELGTDIAAAILDRDPEQPIYLMSEYHSDKVKADAARVGLILQKKFSQRDPAEFVMDIRRLLTKRPCETLPGALGRIADDRRRLSAESPRSSGNNQSAGNTGSSTALVRNGGSAEEISPTKKLRLTSPLVMAARASLP